MRRSAKNLLIDFLLVVVLVASVSMIIYSAHRPKILEKGDTPPDTTAHWDLSIPVGASAIADGISVIIDGKPFGHHAVVPPGQHVLQITNGQFTVFQYR